MAVSGSLSRLNPSACQPLIDIVWVETDKLSNLVERNPPFVNETSNEPLSCAEALSQVDYVQHRPDHWRPTPHGVPRRRHVRMDSPALITLMIIESPQTHISPSSDLCSPRYRACPWQRASGFESSRSAKTCDPNKNTAQSPGSREIAIAAEFSRVAKLSSSARCRWRAPQPCGGNELGLFKKRRSDKEQVRSAPDDEIGTRYRSDLEMSETVALWASAVSTAYGGAKEQRAVAWSVDPCPPGYRPYGGEEGMGGGLTPTCDPDIALAIDVGSPAGTVYLAAWREMVSMRMTRPIVEVWCVTPDDRITGLERQRLERYWHDESLSRWGFIDRGLWGVHDSGSEESV